MNDFTATEFFVYLIFPPLILIFGLFGNIAALIILRRKNIEKIGTQDTYLYLFWMDIQYLLQITVPYLLYGFNLDLTIKSNLGCKIFQYLNYSLDTQSTMLLVYITFERLISVKYPTKVNYLRKKHVQFAYFLIVLIYNLLYYLPIAFYYDLQMYLVDFESNKTALICNFIDSRSQVILGNMDLINRVLLPTITMLIISSVLIQHIFKSRSRIANIDNHNDNNNNNSAQNKNNQKDIKFSITSIVLSIIYACLTLPNSIDVFFENYYLYITYPALLFLFYSSYAVNFYIIILTNSIVRNEFFMFLGFKNSVYPTNHLNIERKRATGPRQEEETVF